MSDIALIQDTRGKKDITSNMNKQSNGDVNNDIDSGNKDEDKWEKLRMTT